MRNDIAHEGNTTGLLTQQYIQKTIDQLTIACVAATNSKLNIPNS